MQLHVSDCGSHIVEAFSEISDIGRDRWPATSVPQSIYLSYDWLESQEGWNTLRSVYIVLRDPESDRILTALPCFLSENPDQVRFDNVTRMLFNVDNPRELADSLPPALAADLRERAAAMRDADALPYPALVATAANAAMFGYAAEAVGRSAHLMDLVSAVEQVAAALGAPTVAFWYVRPVDFPELSDQLDATGYVRTLINADLHLPVTWSSIPEYVASLPRGRRPDIKREIREFAEAGMRVEVRDAAALDGRLANLYAGLQQRFGHPADPGAILRGFDHVRERLADRMRVFVATDGAEPLGFVLALEENGVLYTRQAGFKRAEGSASKFVYFNTLFYAMIEHCIEHGLQSIEYGTESFGAKLKRGAAIRPIEAFVRGPNNGEGLREYLKHYAVAVETYMTDHGARNL